MKNIAIQNIYLVVFYLFAMVVYFAIEALLWMGVPALLTSWGVPQATANGITLAILILALFVISNFGRSTKGKHLKGEAKLAYWIAQNLSNSKSQQWNEYQDWLHDILLARRQLLDNKCPRWKIKLITYRRLSAFCIVVVISKVKQAALRIGRSH